MVMFVQRQDTGPWLRERGFESLTSPQTTGLVVPRVKVSGCLPDQTGSSPVPGAPHVSLALAVRARG